MLGYSTDTIYRRWKSWGLPAFKIGTGNGGLRFRERQIEKWIEDRKA